ncbi:MAG: hypothetical protein IPK16_06870 [Anaerolineales bacterium]|nr:hypothetical protein [Anaerolineales bacterium]
MDGRPVCLCRQYVAGDRHEWSCAVVASATEFETLATIVAPILAGVLTALYVPHRGGMHALLGGALSFVPLWWFIFNGVWQLALFAAAFCTFGGAVTEVVLRSRQNRVHLPH